LKIWEYDALVMTGK